ncbi:hypothetical protein C3Y87_11165 [Carbonactinospora thermoautotrophica]|nr:hypothetical protein [Carbonactinospora thermoautotrophica]
MTIMSHGHRKVTLFVLASISVKVIHGCVRKCELTRSGDRLIPGGVPKSIWALIYMGAHTNGFVKERERIIAMRQRKRWSARIAGAVVAAAAVIAIPGGMTSAMADAPTAGSVTAKPQQELPQGVIELNPGEPCPYRSLCLYRDANFQGPAYAIAEGYNVDLHDLPCPSCAWGPTMANNVSSWDNRTFMTAVLTQDNGNWITLQPGKKISGGPTEDKVVQVTWDY